MISFKCLKSQRVKKKILKVVAYGTLSFQGKLGGCYKFWGAEEMWENLTMEKNELSGR
jgi:hypothetical protein